jgi:glycosyltransferase involved in cell wall biosynthesis
MCACGSTGWYLTDELSVEKSAMPSTDPKPGVRDDLVSCLMPTRDRPHFVSQALRYFARQTYIRSELLVIDDGEQSVERLCAGLPRVRYLRLDRPTLTGTKMNLAIEQACGSVLQKLDDDDYYHPEFLQRAIAALPRSLEEQRRTVVAWDCFLVLFAGETRLRFSGHGWNAGGTLCFSRELWAGRPFRDVRTGYDSWFLADHQPAIIRVCAPEHYIHVRHGGNTWTRMHDATSADEYLCLLPAHEKSLETVVGPDNLPFYAGLSFRNGWQPSPE